MLPDGSFRWELQGGYRQPKGAERAKGRQKFSPTDDHGDDFGVERMRDKDDSGQSGHKGILKPGINHPEHEPGNDDVQRHIHKVLRSRAVSQRTRRENIRGNGQRSVMEVPMPSFR